MKPALSRIGLTGNKGFTLVEMIIVITIISLLAMLVAPRFTNYLSSRRSNFIILTSVIAQTYHDSFLKERTNFITLHLYEHDLDFESEENQDLLSRANGISVLNINSNGTFTESSNRILKYKEFPESFMLESVILPSGEEIKAGSVMIPVYPDGTSNDAILHLIVDDERWSIRIFKLNKEASIMPEFVNFEEL